MEVWGRKKGREEKRTESMLCLEVKTKDHIARTRQRISHATYM